MFSSNAYFANMPLDRLSFNFFSNLKTFYGKTISLSNITFFQLLIAKKPKKVKVLSLTALKLQKEQFNKIGKLLERKVHVIGDIVLTFIGVEIRLEHLLIQHCSQHF